MIETHTHWTFLAFNGPPSETIMWAVEVTVTGRYTEEEAQFAASLIIQRESYKLRRVYDCTTCGFQAATAQSMATMAENSK